MVTRVRLSNDSVFNTVAEMKAADLVVGETVKTAGYTAAGDGGGGDYLIVSPGTGTDDGGRYHDLANGNQAELIIEEFISVKQYGAAGDGVTDDTDAIQRATNYTSERAMTLFFPKPLDANGDFVFYAISQTINPPFAARYRGETSRITWVGGTADPMFAPLGIGQVLFEANNMQFNGGGVASSGIKLNIDTGTAFTVFRPRYVDCSFTDFTQYGIDGGATNASAGGVDGIVERCRISRCGAAGILVAQPIWSIQSCQMDENARGILIGANGKAQMDGCIFNVNTISQIFCSNLSQGGAAVNCWFEGSDVVDFTNVGIGANSIKQLGFYNCQFNCSPGQSLLNFSKLNLGKIIICGGSITVNSGDSTITAHNDQLSVIALNDESGALTYAGNLRSLTVLGGDGQGNPFVLGREQILQIRDNVDNPTDVLELDASNILYLRSPLVHQIFARGINSLLIDADNGRGTLTIRNDAVSALPSSNPPANAVKLYVADTGAGKAQLIARFPSGAQTVLAAEP